MSMFHSNTQGLIDYWLSRAGQGCAPRRAEVDPSDFAAIAPQAFILGRAGSGLYPVRLAGGFVVDLHARDLRGQNGLSLWRQRDRMTLQTALEQARNRIEPLIATAAALSEARAIEMEVLFAPLAGQNGVIDRFLGLYQPLGMVAQLKGGAVRQLAVQSLVSAGPANEEAPRVRLATLDGRRIA